MGICKIISMAISKYDDRESCSQKHDNTLQSINWMSVNGFYHKFGIFENSFEITRSFGFAK